MIHSGHNSASYPVFLKPRPTPLSSMATPTKSERRFFGDLASLKSFGGSGSSSSPPSLKTRSLKPKKTVVLAMPSLLSQRRRSQSGDSRDFPAALRGGISNQDFNVPAPKPPPRHKPEATSPTNRAREVPGTENTDTVGQTKPEKAKRPSSRPKTIIRLISTKFRARARSPSSSSPNPRSPTQTSAFASKEKREAALRERGLLPPLKRNADLSRAEQERDRQIPVLPTPSSEETLAIDGEVRKVTAASKVKQEWEAKNKMARDDDDQRGRMKAFKFGILRSSSIPEDDASIPPMTSTPLFPVEEVDTPLPSPDAAPRSPVVKASEPGSPRPLSLRSRRSLPRDLSVLVSAPSEPHLVPLPPSPLLSATIPAPSDLVPLPLSSLLSVTTPAPSEPHLVPLPPSPLLSAKIPAPPEPHLIPWPASPLPSANIPAPPEPQLIPWPASPLHPATIPLARFDDELAAAHLPPSPNPSIQPTTPTLSTHTSSTFASSTFATTSSPTTASPRSRPQALTVEVHENNIPIIVESPIEEFFVKGSILAPSLSRNPTTTAIEVTLANDKDNATAEADADSEPSIFISAPASASASPAQNPRVRNFTELPPSISVKAPRTRRNSLNPFKRARTLSPGPSSTDSANPSVPPRRLSMISNMRRSVVGTLSRPSNPTIPRTDNHHGFDASHLPPSPTVPAFADQSLSLSSHSPSLPASPKPWLNPTSPRWNMRFAQGAHPPPPEELKPRLAVSPTLHSRGSILIETNNIEDEETRRMTELAFLG